LDTNHVGQCTHPVMSRYPAIRWTYAINVNDSKPPVVCLGHPGLQKANMAHLAHAAGRSAVLQAMKLITGGYHWRHAASHTVARVVNHGQLGPARNASSSNAA
jgi:hypothetical protein